MKETRDVSVVVDCENGNPACADVTVEIDGKKVDLPICAISMEIDGSNETAVLCLRFQSFRIELKNAKMEAVRYPTMSDEDWEAQRQSFAFGNVNIDNPGVTRESIAEAADTLKDGE